MMIKGCILAFAIASVQAEDKSQGARAAYNGSYKAGESSVSGYRNSAPAGKNWGNRQWGNRRRRPRKPRPANWTRPANRPANWARPANRPANWVRPANRPTWVKPAESESVDSVDAYVPTTSSSGYGYENCTANLRATCCDLHDSLPVQQKMDVCNAVGCDYDKCDWTDDGWSGDTAKPTSEPTWSADGWQKDGWNDDGYGCLAVRHVLSPCFHFYETLQL